MKIDKATFLRVKSNHSVYTIGEGIFRIGTQTGYVSEFTDPDGQAQFLLSLLDGTRSYSKVLNDMTQEYEELTEEDIATFIEFLDKCLYIEDAQMIDAEKTRKGLERFDRNVNYFSYYTSTSKNPASYLENLLSKTVLLLGLGGGGSMILPILSASGVGRLIGVDCDRVEISNLNRQFLFRESDVGSLKTEVTERTIKEMNSQLSYTAVERRIESAEDVLELIELYRPDLVISAIDTPPGMVDRRVNYACVATNTPCIYGLTQSSIANFFTVLPHETGCFDCFNIHHQKKDPNFVKIYKSIIESDYSPANTGFPPHIAAIGGQLAAEAIRLLIRHTPPISLGCMCEINFDTNVTTILPKWDRYEEECPTCGTGREEDWEIFRYYNTKGSLHRPKLLAA